MCRDLPVLGWRKSIFQCLSTQTHVIICCHVGDCLETVTQKATDKQVLLRNKIGITLQFPPSSWPEIKVWRQIFSSVTSENVQMTRWHSSTNVKDKDTIWETKTFEESWAPHIHKSATMESAICQGISLFQHKENHTYRSRHAETNILSTDF